MNLSLARGLVFALFERPANQLEELLHEGLGLHLRLDEVGVATLGSRAPPSSSAKSSVP